MKRFVRCTFFATLFLLPFTTSLFAFDWGVTSYSRLGYEFGGDEDDQWQKREKLSLWMEEFWSGEDNSRYSFLFNGYYLYSDEESSDDVDYLFESDLLVFKMKRPQLFGGNEVLDLSVGRFPFSDSTSLVLSHIADGFSAGLDLSRYIVKTGMGYTGLRLKPVSSVNMSTADISDDDDDDIHFAPKRLFEMASVSFPSYLPRQNLTVEGLFQQDLRSDDEDKLNSIHATAKADGAIVGNLYYTLSATGAWNTSDDLDDVMVLADLNYYAQQLLHSRISAGMMYTGEDFFTVSEPTLGLIYSPDEADLFRLDIAYSIRPWQDLFSPALKNLQFLAAGRFYLVPSDDYSYTGTELEGGLTIRPTSDFGMSLTGGLWVPDEGDTRALLRVECSLGL
jgi:hypothetical protein